MLSYNNNICYYLRCNRHSRLKCRNSESAKAKTQIEALVNQPLSDAMTKVDELGYTAKYYYDNGKDNNDYTSYVEETLSNDKSK